MQLQPRELLRSCESWLPPPQPSSSNTLWSPSLSVGLPAAAKLHSYKGVIISWLQCHMIHQPINQQTTPQQSEVSPPLDRALKCRGFRYVADCATTSLWSPLWCSFNFNGPGVDCMYEKWSKQETERGGGGFLKFLFHTTSMTLSILLEHIENK